MTYFFYGLGIIAGNLAVTLFVSFLLSWPAYMLWNGCLVDAVDGVNQITWLQAWGLSILFNFLFKSHTKEPKKD